MRLLFPYRQISGIYGKEKTDQLVDPLGGLKLARAP